jgi:transposase
MKNEAKKRKVHTPEFKAKVGLEALRGVKTINEIGQEYGVHPVQVGQWKKEIQEQAKTLFEGKRGPKPIAAHQEPDLLYSEIGKAVRSWWNCCLPMERTSMPGITIARRLCTMQHWMITVICGSVDWPWRNYCVSTAAKNKHKTVNGLRNAELWLRFRHSGTFILALQGSFLESDLRTIAWRIHDQKADCSDNSNSTYIDHKLIVSL